MHKKAFFFNFNTITYSKPSVHVDAWILLGLFITFLFAISIISIIDQALS